VDRLFIKGLVIRGIIGVNDSERKLPQEIVISLDLYGDLSRAGVTDDIADCVDYQLVVDRITTHVERAARYTVEALAADIARIGLEERGIERVVVRVEKPGAIRACQSVGAEIERIRGTSPARREELEVDRPPDGCTNDKRPERGTHLFVEHPTR
jgi:7,8-dihydroneopterin aldolase/epimerase/oxygenase